MSVINLLYKHEYYINDKICIRIPTVGEILDDEDAYYGIVSNITAMPIDKLVELDAMGIDFTEITAYDLFLLSFEALRTVDTSLVFKDLNLKNFNLAENQDTGAVVLVDRENDIIIDRLVYENIAAVLRKIHHLEKNTRKPGNEEAKRYMLKRAKEKAKRNKNRNRESQLEPLIVAMANAEQFKYGFEGTRELSIYQFNESVRQVIKKVDYNNIMYGVYSGNINAKELSQEERNWLVHK